VQILNILVCNLITACNQLNVRNYTAIDWWVSIWDNLGKPIPEHQTVMNFAAARDDLGGSDDKLKGLQIIGT